MDYDLYWTGDPWAVVFYRRKGDIDRDRANRDAWLAGLYVYEAVCDVAPILIPFAKNPKLQPYRSEPIPLSDEAAEATKKEKEEREREEILARAHAWADSVNARRRQTTG